MLTKDTNCVMPNVLPVRGLLATCVVKAVSASTLREFSEPDRRIVNLLLTGNTAGEQHCRLRGGVWQRLCDGLTQGRHVGQQQLANRESLQPSDRDLVAIRKQALNSLACELEGQLCAFGAGVARSHRRVRAIQQRRWCGFGTNIGLLHLPSNLSSLALDRREIVGALHEAW
jgi:hypothetical protein